MIYIHKIILVRLFIFCRHAHLLTYNKADKVTHLAFIFLK